MNNENFNAGLAYADYKQRQLAYIIAAITAYLMSAYFVIGYFAGHLRVWEWDGSQWAQAIPSAGLVGVMTAYQFFLYSQGDTEGGKKATIIAVCVAVGFSLLSEVGQGMERDSIRMETKSQESPTYKAIVAAIGGSTGTAYNPYAADLQTAEMKLAQCQERLTRGKEKHCEGAKARVDAVNKMIANSNQASSDRALALAGTAKTMERDEKNYHPLVNFIRETTGATGTVASFMLSLTLISFFEYAFHYLGGQYAKAKTYLMQHGYDVTRKLRQPPRRHDGSVTTYADKGNSAPVQANTAPALSALDSAKMTVSDYAEKVEAGLKASPEIIATEYARAQHAREQVYQAAANKLDGIQNNLNDAAVLKKSGGFKQSPEQLAKALELAGMAQVNTPAPLPKMPIGETLERIYADVKASGLKSPDAIHAAVFDAYSRIPSPVELDDADLQKVAAKITDKLVRVDNTTPAPEVPANQKPGATGLHNPVLGTAEQHYTLPLSHGTSTVKEGEGRVFDDTLYEELKGRVVARETEPMTKPVKQLLKVWQVGRNDDHRQHIAGEAFDRMYGEGVLKLNPEQGKFKRKYLLA